MSEMAPPSPVMAVLWCGIQSVVFVLSLYLLVPERIRALDRNHWLHIQYRVRALLVATFVCGLGTTILLGDDKDGLVELLVGERTLRSTVLPLMSYVLLFLGPIVQLRVLPGSSDWNIGCGFWIDLRNLVVAPVTEELVFRTFMTATTISLFSETVLVYGLPLFFGFAHIHHAFLRISRDECTVKTAMMTALFQTLYTTFFGALMMKCLLETKNTLTVILIHSWCNLMGFPAVTAVSDKAYSAPRRILVVFSYSIGILLYLYFDEIVRVFNP